MRDRSLLPPPQWIALHQRPQVISFQEGSGS